MGSCGNGSEVRQMKEGGEKSSNKEAVPSRYMKFQMLAKGVGNLTSIVIRELKKAQNEPRTASCPLSAWEVSKQRKQKRLSSYGNADKCGGGIKEKDVFFRVGGEGEV